MIQNHLNDLFSKAQLEQTLNTMTDYFQKQTLSNKYINRQSLNTQKL